MTSVACDIVLLPSKKITDDAIVASKQLENYKTHFTLKYGEYYPHTSLYMVQLDTENFDAVRKILTKIANETKVVDLVAKRFHQDLGFVDVEYRRDKIIDNLQDKVVTTINPIRDGLRKKDAERIKTATGIELENLEKYGYRSVGSEFAPHITLTRLIDTNEVANIPSDLHTFDGEFRAIGLFEMGDNGTCIKKIFEVPLV